MKTICMVQSQNKNQWGKVDKRPYFGQETGKVVTAEMNCPLGPSWVGGCLASSTPVYGS
jgi:hypothetical protein